MIVSLLLLGSFSILIGTFMNNSDDFEEEEILDQDSFMDETSDTVSIDMFGEDEQFALTNEPTSETEISNSVEIADETEVEVDKTEELNPQTAGLNVLTLDISCIDENESTDPLKDFNSNPNTPILDISDFDYINIEIDPLEGHVEVLRADYYERFGSDEFNSVEGLHTGANFYFIPHGQTFPDSYVWSNDSAALYNEETYTADSSDFGDIRLILRVDTGFSLESGEGISEDLSSDEGFERLKESIIENENIRFF